MHALVVQWHIVAAQCSGGAAPGAICGEGPVHAVTANKGRISIAGRCTCSTRNVMGEVACRLAHGNSNRSRGCHHLLQAQCGMTWDGMAV